MARQSATKAIRNWMYSTSFEDIPPDVRQMGLLAVYDGIGGLLASSQLPLAHRMVDFVQVVGGPPDCTMVGFPLRTSVVNAALVNGTMGHGDEVDVIEGDGVGAHLIAAVLAAGLAAGQLAGASGQEVLRAVVLGYELAKRIHRAAAAAQREAGTASGPVDAGNTMGATAAAGIALGLPPDRMEIALSLAATMACGITAFARESEHMVKSFVRGGVGARNGVSAALMAKVGYDAPRDIFDGKQGFFHSRLGMEEPGAEFLQGLGEDYGITGLVFKSQAAGGPNQAPRQVLLELMAENGLRPADIAEIRAEVNPAGFNTITHVEHPSIYGRDVLALAAVYGGPGFREAHHEAYYNSAEARAMRERIRIVAREDWNTEEGRFHTIVTVKTMDGRELRQESTYRRMTEEDLDAKFSYLVGMRAGEAKARELARLLKGLDGVRNVGEMLSQLELPEALVSLA